MGAQMDAKAIVSAKGQVVIPKMMREVLGLHYGSELIINLRKDDVIEIKQVKKNLSHFFGMGKRIIKEQGLDDSVVDVDEAISQAIMEKNFPFKDEK
jgi:AbrB family looped-hinge helix DNA binding protein